MYQIYICDDDTDTLLQLERITNTYIQSAGLKARIDTFVSPRALLEQNSDGDIYLLDILMPDIDGIKLGTHIRGVNPTAIIIYMTSSREFALDSFSAWPLDYILKPVDESLLHEALKKAFKKLSYVNALHFTIKCRNETITLPLYQIACIEYKSHQIYLSSLQGAVYVSIQSKLSFSSWMEPLLHHKQFIKPHASFVVNMNAIHAIRNDKTFLLTNGCVVPISSNLYTQVKRTYFAYLAEMFETRQPPFLR